MATFSWAWQPYTLPAAAEDIGDVMGAVADGLPGLGYSQVQNLEDVQGFKGDFFVAIVFLWIGGQNFYQVVSVGGCGSLTEAGNELTQVLNMIQNLTFL